MKANLINPKYSPLALAVSLCLAGPAMAQQSENDNEEAALEVISVTARKVTENLQKVPVAVTALTERALRNNAISSLDQVAEESPNVTLEASRATNTTLTAYIRGVGQQDPLWGFEPGVGVSIDDIYLARPQAALLDVYDVERIEVLRGPQGSLYGKNTIGGAIKYVTKNISTSSPFELDVALGSYNQRDIKASGRLEVVEDILWVGGAVASLNRDGFGKYVGPVNEGEENANKDTLAYRIGAEAKLGDDIRIRLNIDRTEDDSNNRGGHRLTDEEVTGLPPLDNLYSTRSGIDPTQEVINEGAALTLDWEISDSLMFKSVTAKREGSTLTSIDFDNQQLSLMEAPGTRYSDEQFSQEFQLTYNSGDFSLVGGLYYFDGEATGAFDLDLFKDLFGGRLVGTRTIGTVETSSKAIYAQGNYEFATDWFVMLGGRYTKDEKTTTSFFSQYNALAGVGNFDNQIVNSDFTRSPSWSDFSPKVGISHQLTPDIMLYTSYSRGFKSGGVDPRANLTVNARAGDPFDPEIVTTIELGIKSQLMDDKVRLNATLFNNDYDDQQVTTSIVVDTTGDGNDDSFAGQVLNAGKASAKGFEVEATAALTDDLQLNLTYGYIDAEFDEFITVDPATLTEINIADTKVVSNTPKSTLNIGLSYHFDLFGGETMVNAKANRRSTVHLFEEPSEIDQPPVTLLNANILWTSPGGDWQLGLHGKNLTNEEYRTSGYYFPTLANSIIGYYGDPRTVTATFSYKFW